MSLKNEETVQSNYFQDFFELVGDELEYKFSNKSSLFFDTIIKWKNDIVNNYFLLTITSENPEITSTYFEIYREYYSYSEMSYPETTDYLTRKKKSFFKMLNDINTISKNEKNLFCKYLNFVYLKVEDKINCNYRKKTKCIDFITNSINTCCICFDETNNKLSCCSYYICLLCYKKLHTQNNDHENISENPFIIHWVFKCPCCRTSISKITYELS
jgi:hypothetical protein